MPAKVNIPNEAIDMYLDGNTIQACADQFGLKVPTLYRRIKSLGIETRGLSEGATRPGRFYQDSIKSNSVVDSNGCWIWGLSKNRFGYGRSCYRGKEISAHRLSYIVYNGEIPEGMIIRHKCDNPLCVNPGHLLTGSHSDNALDAINRGRNAKGERIGNSRLTESQIFDIRENSHLTLKQQADKHGVCRQTIANVINRHTWAHI